MLYASSRRLALHLRKSKSASVAQMAAPVRPTLSDGNSADLNQCSECASHHGPRDLVLHACAIAHSTGLAEENGAGLERIIALHRSDWSLLRTSTGNQRSCSSVGAVLAIIQRRSYANGFLSAPRMCGRRVAQTVDLLQMTLLLSHWLCPRELLINSAMERRLLRFIASSVEEATLCNGNRHY